jgi:hypothetical protein
MESLSSQIKTTMQKMIHQIMIIQIYLDSKACSIFLISAQMKTKVKPKKLMIQMILIIDVKNIWT